MEYKDIFISLAVVLVGIIGILGLVSDWNTAYGVSAGSTFNNTLQQVSLASNLSSLSQGVAATTQTQEGAGASNPQQALITQSLSAIKKLPTFLGLVPALLRDAASILRIPDTIVNIGVYAFLFVFALTFAYLLLIGAKRLL